MARKPPKTKKIKSQRASKLKHQRYIAQIKAIVKQRGNAMKNFKIGETVVEPSIGICRIEGIKRQVVDNKEEDYYIFSSGTAKVYVPMSQIEKRGVRKPMTLEEVKRIYSLLRVPVHPDREDAKLQYLNYREIMKSGDPTRITKLLRDLYTLDQMDELKGKEREIMEQAKKFLVDEIAHIKSAAKSKVQSDIEECLKQMYKKKVAKDKEARRKRSA